MTSINCDSIFPVPAEISDEELTEVGMLLHMHRNFNMSVYKDKYMKRRVAIRMRSARCRDAAEYCSLLRQSNLELDLLQKALTIHVSQFFRNPSMFEKLRNAILPALFNDLEKDAPDPVRFGCLGCASGEEPYSLGILLREYFSRELRQTRAAILGIDIDTAILQTARQAEYNEDHLKDVSMELRDRYFRKNGSRFSLIAEIRDMVTFLHGDITGIASDVKCDLVLCRNTLIYFTRPDQERILHGIADILPQGGILVLGKSETLAGDVRRRFVPICPVERIYRKI
jgi:chemotaxis protein methyltransferase CheR